MVLQPNSITSELFVFDVCDTLYYSNTTFDFIFFVLNKRNKQSQLRYFNWLTRRTSLLFIVGAIWHKVTKKDVIKEQVLRLLKGFSKTDLYLLAQEFLVESLDNRKIKETHLLVSATQDRNVSILLLSASLDPVVAAIAKAIGADFKSSVLEYDLRGICTGRLVKEMTGNKLKELQESGRLHDVILTVATDNFSDKALVAAAKKRYVIVYNEKAKAYWQELSPEFIQLYSS